MKIGIYGDSFASSGDKETSWGNQLNKFYTVENHGRAMTSVEWSVDKFVNTYKNYDKIVFVVTQPSRMYFPEHPKYPHWTPFTHDLIKNLNKQMRVEYENYIRFTLKYVHNDNMLMLKQTAYLNLVKTLQPQTLFISAFANCIEDYDMLTLTDISGLDMINPKSLNYLHSVFEQNSDTRACHMNATNNLILSKKIKHWIETDEFDLYNIDDFFIPYNRDEIFSINKRYR